MNINNFEVLDLEDSKLYVKEENEIIIIENQSNYENKKTNKLKNISNFPENKNLKKNIIMKNKKSVLNNLINTFDNKFYKNLFIEYIEYSFNLLKPFEIFYYELNRKQLDKYIF